MKSVVNPATAPVDADQAPAGEAVSSESSESSVVKLPPRSAPTELAQLLTQARNNPAAPFDPRLLKYIKHIDPVPSTSPDHLSRDLTLPLAHRLNCYAYARQLELDAAGAANVYGPCAPTKLNWWPRGRDLPCPDHRDLDPRFFTSRPGAAGFYAFFYTHRLPLPPLAALIEQQQKIEKANRAES